MCGKDNEKKRKRRTIERVNDMVKKKTQVKNKQVKEREISWLLLPLLLILGVLPLVTRLTLHQSEIKELLFKAGTEKKYDIFLYGKGCFLIAVAGVMVVILVWKWFTDRDWPKLNKGFIFLGIYALFVFLSSVCSQYDQVSLKGAEDSYESMFVLLSYCILPVYAYVFVRDEKDIKGIFKWWPVGIGLLILIGISQFIGHDFWSTEIGKRLLIPVSSWGTATLAFNFEAGRVYLSQYNPNYVGPLAAMIVLLFITLAFFAKGWKKKTIYGVVAGGMFLCLLASQSKNGLIALFFGGILLCLFLHKRVKKYWYVFGSVFLLFIGAVLVLDFSRDHIIFNAVKSSWNSITAEKGEDDYHPEVDDIQAGDEYIEVTYKGNTIYIKGIIDEEKNTMTFELVDEDGKNVSYAYDSEKEKVVIEDPRFEEIGLSSTKIDDIKCVSVILDGTTFRFSDQVGKKGYYYASPNGIFTKMEKAESALFTNMPKLASGRGYIWARSVPLLKDTVILGYGADNYQLYFPQYDYVAAYKCGFLGKIVGSPHNMFLQIGINTGLISLIGFLGFFLVYFIDCIRLYRKEDFQEFLPQAGIGICAACFAYMMTGFLNDSVVCVAPVFWCLIGMGLAVNRIYKKGMRK